MTLPIVSSTIKMQTQEVQLQISSSSSVYLSCYYFLNKSYAPPKKDACILPELLSKLYDILMSYFTFLISFSHLWSPWSSFIPINL